MHKFVAAKTPQVSANFTILVYEIVMIDTGEHLIPIIFEAGGTCSVVNRENFSAATVESAPMKLTIRFSPPYS